MDITLENDEVNDWAGLWFFWCGEFLEVVYVSWSKFLFLVIFFNFFLDEKKKFVQKFSGVDKKTPGNACFSPLALRL